MAKPRAARSRLKRLTRFGLRSLLLLMAVVALWCGFYASQARWRGQALSLIEDRGGYTWRRPDEGAVGSSFSARAGKQYDELVYRLFGESLRPNVTAVDLSSGQFTVDDLNKLTALSEIQWLTVTGPELDDAAVDHLAKFRQLRWLDVNGTNISADGLAQLGSLPELEWLDVSNTQVERDQLDAIRTQFSSARVGFPADPAKFADSGQETFIQPIDAELMDDLVGSALGWAKWQTYLNAPYEDELLRDYLRFIWQAQELPSAAWYISGVYQAERADRTPLLVVQFYKGTRNSFTLGGLLVFDASGRLIRTMPGERVQWSLEVGSQQTDWYESQNNSLTERINLAKDHKVLDLPDLNGDGFDEISTEIWGQTIPSEDPRNARGDGTAIYTTVAPNVPCILRIGEPHSNGRASLIDLTGTHVTLVYREAAPQTLFLETPCYKTTPAGTTLLADLPRRTLGRFVWSQENGTFLGPAHGPNDTWVVLPP